MRQTHGTYIMNSTNSHAEGAAKVTIRTPISAQVEVAEGRRELARVIGRLLANEWLHKQRAAKQGRDRGGVEQDEPRPSA
jgi:hypothetical protein